jgi:hypothetical protein
LKCGKSIERKPVHRPFDLSLYDLSLYDPSASAKALKEKPLNTSNGFGVQLTKTISTAQWFLHSF